VLVGDGETVLICDASLGVLVIMLIVIVEVLSILSVCGRMAFALEGVSGVAAVLSSTVVPRINRHGLVVY